MGLRFHTLDVFTQTALAGNPLAVVHDADGLSDARMQAIAREFNLSETVFLVTPENAAHTARMRIFTPSRELPFAGHPTVGTAALLAQLNHPQAGEHEAIITLEEEIGTVRAGVVIKPDVAPYAEFDVPQLAAQSGSVGPRADVSAALGLTEVEIGFANHRPTVYSAGVPFAFVPVRDREALSRARPITALWDAAGFTEAGGSVFVYTAETDEPDHAFSARMFAPEFGIAEDPATGGAVAAFAGVVSRYEALAAGRHILPIEQGVDMGRPSLITLELEIAAGRLKLARIGGHSVLVSSGELLD